MAHVTDGRGDPFRRVWAGQAISALGDAFAFVAIPLLVLEATGSVARMGLVSATGVAAQMIGGLFSGAIADRVNRRKLMIACDLGRTAARGAQQLVALRVRALRAEAERAAELLQAGR